MRWFFILVIILSITLSCGGVPESSYRIYNISYFYPQNSDLYVMMDYTIVSQYEYYQADTYRVAFDVYDTEGYIHTVMDTLLVINSDGNATRRVMIPLEESRNITGAQWYGTYTVREIVPRSIELRPLAVAFNINEYIVPFLPEGNGSWIALSGESGDLP